MAGRSVTVPDGAESSVPFTSEGGTLCSLPKRRPANGHWRDYASSQSLNYPEQKPPTYHSVPQATSCPSPRDECWHSGDPYSTPVEPYC
jgi:hypothetical protein